MCIARRHNRTGRMILASLAFAPGLVHAFLPASSTTATTTSTSFRYPHANQPTVTSIFANSRNGSADDIDLNEEMRKAEETTETLQKFLVKVSALSEQLVVMETKLRDNRLEWKKEKNELLRKISILASLLNEQNKAAMKTTGDSYQSNEDTTNSSNEPVTQEQVEMLQRELKISREREEELLYEQERLEREVGILQNEIVSVQNLFRAEQYKTEELAADLEEYQRRDQAWEEHCADQERRIQELQGTLGRLEQEAILSAELQEDQRRDRDWEEHSLGQKREILQELQGTVERLEHELVRLGYTSGSDDKTSVKTNQRNNGKEVKNGTHKSESQPETS